MDDDTQHKRAHKKFSPDNELDVCVMFYVVIHPYFVAAAVFSKTHPNL